MPLFEEYVRLVWLPLRREQKVSWQVDEIITRQHLVPCFGRKRLDEISAGQIGKWLKDRSRVTAPSTRNRWLMCLRGIFRQAVADGLLAKSPAAGVSHEAIAKREMAQPESARVDALVEALYRSGNSAAHALLLIMITGGDKSRILRCRWEDVCLEENCLWLDAARPGSRRRIPLPPEAVDLLKGLPRGESPWLFPGANPARPRASLYPFWDRLRKTLGFEGVRICDLGRIYAVRKLAGGASAPLMRLTRGDRKFREIRGVCQTL